MGKEGAVLSNAFWMMVTMHLLLHAYMVYARAHTEKHRYLNTVARAQAKSLIVLLLLWHQISA